MTLNISDYISVYEVKNELNVTLHFAFYYQTEAVLMANYDLGELILDSQNKLTDVTTRAL